MDGSREAEYIKKVSSHGDGVSEWTDGDAAKRKWPTGRELPRHGMDGIPAGHEVRPPPQTAKFHHPLLSGRRRLVRLVAQWLSRIAWTGPEISKEKGNTYLLVKKTNQKPKQKKRGEGYVAGLTD